MIFVRNMKSRWKCLTRCHAESHSDSVFYGESFLSDFGVGYDILNPKRGTL